MPTSEGRILLPPCFGARVLLDYQPLNGKETSSNYVRRRPSERARVTVFSVFVHYSTSRRSVADPGRPHEWHVCLHEGGILRCTLPHQG